MPFKIYYLDDEPELLEIFVEFFESPNCIISVFTNSAEAINETRVNPPDLLILDYSMPDRTGDEVAQIVGPDIPKIMITGNLELMPKSHFLKIFRKPYNLFELKAFIEDRQKLKEASID